MAKDHHSTKSLARTSYEKISKVTFGSFHRISNRSKNDTPNRPPPSSTTGPTSVEEPIPIPNPTPSESFRPPGPKPFKRFVRFSSSDVKKTAAATAGGGGGKEVAGQKTFSEEKYNSYIDHTKMKMRAPSAVSGGGGRTISRRETFNDMFSSYISRTKMRLRTTSSVGNDEKTVASK